MKFTIGMPMRRMTSEGAFGDPAFVRDVVQFADDAGFWGITAPDHIVAPNAWIASGGGEQWIDPFVLLGFAAAHSVRLRLITHVIVLPYRTPFEVAKAVASLDHVSGGRVVFGAGSGYLKEEFDVLGVPFAERGARTDEALRIIKACWTAEGDIDFDGEFWSIHDARMAPRPAGTVPIWIGGNSPRALRRAVELGDCWAPFNVTDDFVRASMNAARANASLTDARADTTDTDGARSHSAGPVELALPLGRAKQGDASGARVEQLASLGADYVKCAFAGATPGEWFENALWFAQEFVAEPKTHRP